MTLNPVYAALQIGLITSRHEAHPDIYTEINKLTGHDETYYRNYDPYIRDGVYTIRHELNQGITARLIFQSFMTMDSASVVFQKINESRIKHASKLHNLINAAPRSSNFEKLLINDYHDLLQAYKETEESIEKFACNLDGNDFNFFMDIADKTDAILWQRKKRISYRLASAPTQALLPSGA